MSQSRSQLNLFAPQPAPPPIPARAAATHADMTRPQTTKALTPRTNMTVRSTAPDHADPPRFRICVLGSGSGGNATVVQHGEQTMLIDAGFGPRTVAHRIQQLGLDVRDIRCICLTHLDQDHFRPTWLRTLIGLRIRIRLHEWQVRHLERLPGGDELVRAGLVDTFNGQAFEPIEGVVAETVTLPHDDKGTQAYHLRTATARLGYATDLGHVPDQLVETFTGIDVLMLESNYDPQMQLTSSRPHFLKQRIMGAHGHLSNEQALAAAQRIADRGPRGNPQRIVLLHRSAQCNTAQLVRETFEADPRFARCITITQQRRRSAWIEVRPLAGAQRQQLSLGL